MAKKKESLVKKILPAAALKRKLAGKTGIVFTNGCFDILHPGHVLYLEKARSLGRALVVAVNSDRSIQAIKGPTRPINPLDDRLKVIAALESVSFVTWFEEDTPEKLYEQLKPKILVKGGDWELEQIVGAPGVIARGGKVHTIELVQGKSSTSIIEKIALVKRLGK